MIFKFLKNLKVRSCFTPTYLTLKCQIDYAILWLIHIVLFMCCQMTSYDPTRYNMIVLFVAQIHKNHLAFVCYIFEKYVGKVIVLLFINAKSFQHFFFINLICKLNNSSHLITATNILLNINLSWWRMLHENFKLPYYHLFISRFSFMQKSNCTNCI